MSFDQLKREAANLERQLEDKLSRYQQVCYFSINMMFAIL
jgi:hypothetical protein